MFKRSTYIVVFLLGLVTAAESRSKQENRGQGQNQGRGAGSWFGLRSGAPGQGASADGAHAHGHSGAPYGYGQQSQHHGYTTQGGASGAQGGSSLYPGLPENARRSPRMSKPRKGGSSTGYPVPPQMGETRNSYESRVRGSYGKDQPANGVPSSAVPHVGKSYSPAAPGEGAAPTPSSRLANPKTRYSSPAVYGAEAQPAMDRIRMRMEEKQYGPPLHPSQVQVDFQKAQQRLEKALQRRDYEAVDRETEALRRRVHDIKRSSNALPLDDKLDAMNIAPLAEEAIEHLSEGRATQQDSKIRMGIQKLGKATKGSKQQPRR